MIEKRVVDGQTVYVETITQEVENIIKIEDIEMGIAEADRNIDMFEAMKQELIEKKNLLLAL